MKEIDKSALRRERERRGWSRSYVAEMTDSDPRTVGRWERGDKTPNSYHLQLLCQIFGMRPQELGLLHEDESNGEEQALSPLPSDPWQESSAVPVSKENIPISDNAIPSFAAPITGSMTSSSLPPSPKKYKKWWLIDGAVAVFFVASFIVAFPHFYPNLHTSNDSQSNPVVYRQQLYVSDSYASSTLPPDSLTTSKIGSISFKSSGYFTTTSNQGMSDEVQINLRHIPAPDPGKSYYAWLSGHTNQSEAYWLPLGKFTFSNGNASLFYPGDIYHTNLLAIDSRVRITEEDTHVPPIQPTSMQSAWKYYVQIPQIPIPTDPHHYSLLDHLRHLLAADPSLNKMGLRGGLDFWLYNDMQNLLTLTTHAVNEWNAKNVLAAHNQFICMLDYLDGNFYIHQDVPPGTTQLATQRFLQIGLLEGTPQQEPPGILAHIDQHVTGVLNSPGATSSQQALAYQLQKTINTVSSWLEKVRQNTKQLVMMDGKQLLQPSTHSLLSEMETQLHYAYNGQSGLSRSNSLQGAYWIYMNIQYLATLSVNTY